ncbi:adenylyltransferase/cytidyltransferase family protein [Clostridium estertheticum]|uniref:adenylyltransferase/cytidyltransferase family protein n=1 Tax=Clostridium estertheticum TaxID=238834 RepID=UPI0013E97BBD|nr:adenylyltransferase/cytidyltransferase family protein [Clostridium estertheticum]MBZ9689209.1 adenylyltransferase/cytidyltransferase family protein [Clostridium estertheticum]
MKKYKIGFIAGVFDLFHIGHLNILKKAKEQCEYLIVGVNTDEVVQGYKHKIPIIPLEERMAIVKAIIYVDQVIPLTSRDKLKAWKTLKFDVIFAGDDWKNSNLYNNAEMEFKEVNVDVVFFSYTKGTSSTILGDILTKMLTSQQLEKMNQTQ